MTAAEMAAQAGAGILRGGAFKPRSSPYSFQGLGTEGLDLLAEAGRSVGLPVVTECLRVEDVELVAESADMVQVGARNMQNFELLKAIGRLRTLVLLKRGLSATVRELYRLPNTSSPAETTRSFCVSEASGRSRWRLAPRWTFRPCPSSRNSRTCPSSWIRLTQLAGGNS